MRFSMVILVSLVLVASGVAVAQDKAKEPPKPFTGNFGAGLSVTGGNTDTKSFNLSFEATHDPKTKNIIKTNGLYLRSDANNATIADMLRLGFRDDYLLTKRVSVYGAVGYLRDPFKSIDYLLNPQGGLGFKVYTSDQVTFTLSGGAGGVWEKNKGLDVRSSGTLNAGESFSFKLSDTAKLVQNLTAMWKTQEFKDALYHFDIALITRIAKKFDLKIEFMDDYKNRTPFAHIKKNDTALIVSLLYKF